MIKIFYCAFILLALSSCTKTNVTITGKIKNANRQKIYLEQLNVEQPLIIDSTRTNAEGHFKFKTTVESPAFFNIKTSSGEFITFIAEPEANIELTGTYQGLTHNYWVDGSENSLWIKLLNFQLHNTQIALDSLKKAFNAIPQDETHRKERLQTATAWDSVRNKQIHFSREFILKHAISPASYYALYQKFNDGRFILTPEKDLHSFKIVASSLKAMYPESQYTQAILKHLSQINKGIRSEQLRQLIANSENTLPEISLPDRKGDTVSLNSLKGKYVVLDFTVLNTKDSKAYSDNLKKVYNKFKGKGVQIYQVCLDDNQDIWQNLVKKYDIDWICVRDTNGLHSHAAKAYNIQSIPSNYIINPKSEIVGKNLNGRRLEERLHDLLK